jgi:protein-L-isoaspartate O-methyltransferase
VSGRIPDRVRWAVEILDVQPSEQILEIGPGPGVALGLVCDRLVDGHITAIDRSAVAVRRTSERNAQCVSAGKATVIQADVTECGSDGRRFDKIFAINVNVFWVQPDGPQVPIVAGLLRPRGRLSLFYESPDAAKADRVVETTQKALCRHGFTTSTSSATQPPMRCVEAWLEAERRSSPMTPAAGPSR